MECYLIPIQFSIPNETLWCSLSDYKEITSQVFLPRSDSSIKIIAYCLAYGNCLAKFTLIFGKCYWRETLPSERRGNVAGENTPFREKGREIGTGRGELPPPRGCGGGYWWELSPDDTFNHLSPSASSKSHATLFSGCIKKLRFVSAGVARTQNQS